MNDLALAVINTGSHYKERREWAQRILALPERPEGGPDRAAYLALLRRYKAYLAGLCAKEAREPHYGGRRFRDIEITQAAEEVCDYMLNHVQKGYPMSATKSDYEAIAAAIHTERVKVSKPVWGTSQAANSWRLACEAITLNIADHFAKNPKFDRAKFLRDCGVQP
jgi:hypothetical protein